MTVNPYTLNHLYSQGILDYVPYDLCPAAQNVPIMYGFQNPYLNTAMQGNLYKNSTEANDTFEKDKNLNFWDKIPKPIKGVISGGLIVGSLALVLRGKKKPASVEIAEKTSFWQKMNPKNWFKKTKL